jgi:hypothetical protein
MNQEREPGFYWVKHCGQWVVARLEYVFNESEWYTCGDECWWRTEHFDAIGDKITHDGNGKIQNVSGV